MTVRLENVVKTRRMKGQPLQVLKGVNLEIGRGERIAILGCEKSGKSTLLEVICGSQQPDSGRIVRDISVSWPIPRVGFLLPTSRLAWSIRWLARIYGLNASDFVRRVGQLGEIAAFLNRRPADCPPFVRQQLGFAVGIAMDFDLYLFDDRLVPQRREFRERAFQFLDARTSGKSTVLATNTPQALSDRCDTIHVLENGRLTHFTNQEEGLEHFQSLLEAEKERKKAIAESGDVDESGDGMAGSEDAHDAAMGVGAIL